ncbi:MAG: hypothetical protein QM572_07635, partial [Nocardioides sp.]
MTPLDDRLEALIAAEFGAGVADRLFEHEHLSRVVGLLLTDGRRIVVKIRPSDPRHHGCSQVQRTLFAAGFPCAQLLHGPVEVGDDTMSVERYVTPPGPATEYSAPSAAASGAAFRRLAGLAPAVAEVPDLG